MPVCPHCHRKSTEIAVACTCGKRYTVDELTAKDPLDLLGTEIDNKYVPVFVMEIRKHMVMYRAVQPYVGRNVALAILNREAASTPSVVDAFYKHATASAAFNHPNIVAPFDTFRDHNELVGLATEYFESEILEKLIENARLDILNIPHIIHQILTAVRDAHAHELIVSEFDLSHIRIAKIADDSFCVKLNGVSSKREFSSEVYEKRRRKNLLQLALICLSLVTGKSISPNQLLNNTKFIPKFVALSNLVDVFTPFLPLHLRAEDYDAASCLEQFELAMGISHPKNMTPIPRTIENFSPSESGSMRLFNAQNVAWLHSPPKLS